MSVDLVLDGLSTQTKSSVKSFCDQVSIALKILERAILWANLAELCIALLKEEAMKFTKESNYTMVI